MDSTNVLNHERRVGFGRSAADLFFWYDSLRNDSLRNEPLRNEPLRNGSVHNDSQMAPFFMCPCSGAVLIAGGRPVRENRGKTPTALSFAIGPRAVVWLPLAYVVAGLF